MINSSEFRVACPSVSFFFAHLGASLGTSRVFLPSIANFVSEGNKLGMVLVGYSRCFVNQLTGLRVY